MNVKTDTKEKFTVITPVTDQLSANMTDELAIMLLAYIQKDIPHLILKLSEIKDIESEAADKLANIQQSFYENNCSFVICELPATVAKVFEEKELLDIMNITPTESEAWDILQMEEVERELLNED
ncbi:MAG: STAS domain-containing protein [Chitinophagaceae bacterium]